MGADGLPAILLFGAPGVGKGTQGRILNSIPGLRHVSSGEILRGIDPQSPEGREIATFADRGELVPDDVTIRAFRSVIEQSIDGGQFQPDEELLLLDGIPRTRNQAEILSQTFQVMAVILFAFDDENVVVDRLKSRALKENRVDDANEETIRHRFEIYRRQTEPILAFYAPETVHRIDAQGTPVEVLRDVLDACGVAVVPGLAFGLSPHFRISYAAATEVLEDACDRIRQACAALA